MKLFLVFIYYLCFVCFFLAGHKGGILRPQAAIDHFTKEIQQFVDIHILSSFSFEIDMHNIFCLNLAVGHITFPS